MAQVQGSLKFEGDGLFRDSKGLWDYAAQEAAETEWILENQRKLREKARKMAGGDLVGEEVCFQQGDGMARYLIVKQRPFTLVHLDVADAWQADAATIRGFRLVDARAQVEKERAFQDAVKKQEIAYRKLLKEHKVLHYHDGFDRFIRCEVVEDAGSKVGGALKMVALVGNWEKYDLRPESYRVRQILTGETFLPHVSHIYEGNAYWQKTKSDPRRMEPLTLPDAFRDNGVVDGGL